MRRLTLGIIATAILFTSAPPAESAPPILSALLKDKEEKSKEVQWQKDLPTAHRIASAQGKPILIVFGAEWCGFCKKLESQTLNSKEVAPYINEKFVAVHLDLDKSKKAAELLEVKALPCCVILTKDAEMLGRVQGFKGKDDFKDILVQAEQQFSQIQTASQDVPVVR